jgi:hypothetical protein
MAIKKEDLKVFRIKSYLDDSYQCGGLWIQSTRYGIYFMKENGHYVSHSSCLHKILSLVNKRRKNKLEVTDVIHDLKLICTDANEKYKYTQHHFLEGCCTMHVAAVFIE